MLHPRRRNTAPLDMQFKPWAAQSSHDLDFTRGRIGIGVQEGQDVCEDVWRVFRVLSELGPAVAPRKGQGEDLFLRKGRAGRLSTGDSQRRTSDVAFFAE